MKINELMCASAESQGSTESDSTETRHQAAPKCGISFLLCNAVGSEQSNALVQHRRQDPDKRPRKKAKLNQQRPPDSTTTMSTSTLSVIPDKDRKRSYRLSTKQRERRLDNQALESRTYNLTLDINDLKQQVRHLQECRDLYGTRLMIARQQAQGEAVGMVARLFRLFCDETCGTNDVQPDDRSIFLSRVHSRLTDPSAGGRDGVPHFMMTWRNFKVLFTHRSYTVKSIRLVSHLGVQEDTEDDDPCEMICTDVVSVLDEARQRCGPGGGCVVESKGEFTGRLKRDTIAAVFPRLLQNETLVLRLIGQRFSCPLRMMAYFNAQGQLVDHVAEFDMIGALNVVIELARQQ